MFSTKWRKDSWDSSSLKERIKSTNWDFAFFNLDADSSDKFDKSEVVVSTATTAVVVSEVVVSVDVAFSDGGFMTTVIGWSGTSSLRIGAMGTWIPSVSILVIRNSTL